MKKMADKKKAMKSLAENTVVSPVVEVKEQTAVEKSLAVLIEKIASLKSQGLTGDNALAEIQKNFDELGNVVKAEFIVPPSPEEVAKQNMAEIVRAALSEMLPQALASVLAPMQSEMQNEMTELRALTQTPKLIRKEETPKPRGLSAALVQKAAIEKVLNKPKDQFQAIADASVGLQ
jgi:hypothetical protein